MVSNPISSFSNILNMLNPFGTSNQIDSKNILTNMKNINLDNYKLFIIDIDGVLTLNNEPTTLGIDAFNNLSKNNKKICILSNECKMTPKNLRDNLIKMGFNLNNSTNILTGTKLTLIKLDEILKENKITQRTNKKKKVNISLSQIKNGTFEIQKNKQYKIGVIGNDKFYFHIKRKTREKYTNVYFYWIEDMGIPEDLDLLIVSDVNRETENIIEKSLRWFKDHKENNKTFDIMLTHLEERKDKDNITPIQLFNLLNDHFYWEGINIKDYNKICLGKVFYSNYIDNILRKYNENENISRNKILVVGDNLNSDMKFGNEIGADKCLVLSGNTTINDLNCEDVNNLNYIIPDISYLVYN